MSILLQGENLLKHFSSQRAVDGLSFKVESGSIFGLLGPNGAGKTTLIRMITGITMPDSGNIYFKQKPFNAEEHAKDIGYMPEERGLYKKMKIGEQAIYLSRLKGLSASDANLRVKEWFVRLGMQTWWDKKVEDLSKGMSQKLQFVTTVAHNPSLIILDEPFSGLDPVNANLIKDEIFRLAKEGSTIIFSTHRMEQVEEICDSIILVNQGKKILEGTVNQVKQQFKENKYEVVTSEMQLPQFENISSLNPQVLTDKMVFTLPQGYNSNDLLKSFIHQGFHITHFSEVLPSLNDIFIRQVEGSAAARTFTH